MRGKSINILTVNGATTYLNPIEDAYFDALNGMIDVETGLPLSDATIEFGTSELLNIVHDVYSFKKITSFQMALQLRATDNIIIYHKHLSNNVSSFFTFYALHSINGAFLC